ARGLGPLRHREMEKPRGRRKGRSVRRFGKPADMQRAADPDLFVEDQRGQFTYTMKLAGASGQHDATPGELVEAAELKPVAHEFEGLLDARGDDADEKRFGNMVDVPVLFLTDL